MDGFFLAYLGQGYLFGIPFPVIIMIIAFALLFVLLHKDLLRQIGIRLGRQ
jgi:ribose transport system permease protein